MGVLFRQGNESIREFESNWSSSAAVEADPLRAASTEIYTEFNWTWVFFPPRPPAHSRCAPGYQDTGSLCPSLATRNCSLNLLLQSNFFRDVHLCRPAGYSCIFHFLNPLNFFSERWATYFLYFLVRLDISYSNGDEYEPISGDNHFTKQPGKLW